MSEANKKTQLVKKHKIGLFLKNEREKFVRMKKSVSLTLSMNPQEEENDYIADESPTTELVDYKPSIDQDLVMYAGEPDYEMMWKYFYELHTGSDAHTDCMVVFMHRPVDAKGNDIPVGDTTTEVAGYRAWLTDSIISIQDMNATEKKLNFKVLFGGGITHGIATVSEEEGPVFTPASKWKAPEEVVTPEPGGSSDTPPEVTPGTDQEETPETEPGDNQETGTENTYGSEFDESEG